MSEQFTMILLSCSDCKHYTMKNSNSYCTKKRKILTFLERNWTGTWSEYEFTCFRPSPKTREMLNKHYEKLGL